jgi:hypothetical protein
MLEPTKAELASLFLPAVSSTSPSIKADANGPAKKMTVLYFFGSRWKPDRLSTQLGDLRGRSPLRATT